MRRSIAAAIRFIVPAAFMLPAVVRSTDGRSEPAHALLGTWLQVESDVAASVSEGTPVSAKYEIDDGASQLSMYTWKPDTEVIVDSVRLD